MSGPQNDRYLRDFGDPDNRPSARWCDPVVEHTRWRVEQLARELDQQNRYDPVFEAERVAQVEADRRERFRRIGSTSGENRRGDPGE